MADQYVSHLPTRTECEDFLSLAGLEALAVHYPVSAQHRVNSFSFALTARDERRLLGSLDLNYNSVKKDELVTLSLEHRQVIGQLPLSHAIELVALCEKQSETYFDPNEPDAINTQLEQLRRASESLRSDSFSGPLYLEDGFEIEVIEKRGSGVYKEFTVVKNAILAVRERSGDTIVEVQSCVGEIAGTTYGDEDRMFIVPLPGQDREHEGVLHRDLMDAMRVLYRFGLVREDIGTAVIDATNRYDYDPGDLKIIKENYAYSFGGRLQPDSETISENP